MLSYFGILSLVYRWSLSNWCACLRHRKGLNRKHFLSHF